MEKGILTTNLMFNNNPNVSQVRAINGVEYISKDMIIVNDNKKEKIQFVIRLLKPETKFSRKVEYGLYLSDQSKFIYQFTESYYNILSTRDISFEHSKEISSFIKYILYDICSNLNILLDSASISVEEIASILIMHSKNKKYN